jgi:hypothetical protein
MKMLVLLATMAAMMAEPVRFLGREYKLGFQAAKPNPMFEYVTGGETVQNWTSLVTLIDRADAKTLPDLDRLAQGVMDTYKSRGGKVLMARTMKDAGGKPLNYMIVAFEDPAKKRWELSFVKAAMGAKNAYIAVYGVRVAEPKKFLTDNSQAIGQELEKLSGPGK